MKSYILPIHFGNFDGKHEISAESLTVFIDSYRDIAEQFGLQVEIQVGVPSEGGWKIKLSIHAAILAGALNFIGIDNLSILFTGKESKEFFYDAHSRLSLLGEFLTKKSEEIQNELPKEIIRQKNKIYEFFYKDENIHTFKLGNHSAIRREDFWEYIQEVPDEACQYFGESNITVYSPDWKGTRSWSGHIDNVDMKVSTFAFDKLLTGRFWEQVKLDTLPLHSGNDVMRVQLIHCPNNRVKFLVIRVLAYNGIDIDMPLLLSDISKFAQIDTALDKTPAQGDLFYGVTA